MAPAVSLNHTEALDGTPTSNKKEGEKHSAPTSHLEEKKSKGEVSQAKKPAEAKHVASATHQKKAEGMDETRASKLQQLKASHVARPSRAKQASEEPSRGADAAQGRSAQLPTIRDHSASATHRVPTAIPQKRFKAADFKLEPQWAFDDEYLLDNSFQQSSCPNSLRDKAAKSDWLKNVLLPNITIFMDKSHFSDHEWERMEHFVPPFGFMEKLKLSLIPSVLELLPLNTLQSPNLSMCAMCSIIHDGDPTWLTLQFDLISWARVSGAVIKDYEKDVGTRTSFYGFTSFSLATSIASLSGQGFKKVPMGKDIQYLHFLEGERDYEWLKALLLNMKVRKGFFDYYGSRPRENFDKDFNLDKYHVIHPDFLRYTKNRFLKSQNANKPYWRIYRPTTGAFLLLTALHLCDQVSAYGYITEGYQNYSDHYYDKIKKKLIFYANHDFDLERRVWKKLHDANIMKLYQRS
uniref:alpha-N-acetylgalactosaminide alpha-2,6-sialyltransferase n=1 Tax=Varanus komodoensis TaxID=61221 RepID=A0A8D2LP96_VARKO